MEYMYCNENSTAERKYYGRLCMAPPSPPRPPAGPRSRLNLAGKASQGSFLALRIGFCFHKPSLQNKMVARTPVCDYSRNVPIILGTQLLSCRGGEHWTMQWHACLYKPVLTH